jgi:hypothetical protein
MLETDKAGEEGWGLWPKEGTPLVKKVGVLAEYVGLGTGEPRSGIVQQPTADGVAMACQGNCSGE